MNPAPAFHFGGARELKLRLAPEQVAPVSEWLRATLRADPHGEGLAGDAYAVHSLYFDTPALDVLHRRGLHGQVKFRVRRYGAAPRLFAERKLKRRGRVNKHRTALGDAEMPFFNGTPPPETWPSLWFRRRLQRHALRPVVALSYRRIARVGQSDAGPVRATLDRALVACLAAGLTAPAALAGPDLLGGGAILELKFQEALPALFRRLIEQHRLAPAGFSKYRFAAVALGLAVPGNVLPGSRRHAAGEELPVAGKMPAAR
jgi:hypothetical protein